MEGTEWSQRGSSYDNVRGVIIHNKFLCDIQSNVQGKMCMVRFFFFSVLQIYSVINQTHASCKRFSGCKFQLKVRAIIRPLFRFL